MMRAFRRHLERLGDLGDIPTEVFIDLLKRAKEKATPEIVKRFQDINEVQCLSLRFVRGPGKAVCRSCLSPCVVDLNP